jgi:hypothetical protein
MKPKLSLKNLLRFTFFIITLLSLAACDNGCDPADEKIPVTVYNKSNSTVDISIAKYSSSLNDAQTALLPPQGTVVFGEDSALFFAVAETKDKWLDFARAQRNKLLSEADYLINNPSTPDQFKKLNDIQEKLNQITEEIHSHQNESTKECRTFLIPGYESVVLVSNGESPNTINIACLLRDVKTGEYIW